MKKKNFKILKKLAEKGLRQSDLVRKAELSSETRLSRIIHYLVNPKDEEVDRICRHLDLKPTDIKGGEHE
jgi:DNA-binding Xre family transcriptional regulator